MTFRLPCSVHRRRRAEVPEAHSSGRGCARLERCDDASGVLDLLEARFRGDEGLSAARRKIEAASETEWPR